MYLGRNLSYNEGYDYGYSPFYNKSTLTEVTIGDSVTSIGDYAFYDCTGLTSITIPNSVTSIGGSAFSGCANLTDVTIPNSVTSIGDCEFLNCSSLASVTIPNSVTSIGDGAFRNCSSLASVTIPNSVTSIGNYAFYGCTGLTSITIPNSVTIIGDYTFNGCTALEELIIEDGTKTLKIYNYSVYDRNGLVYDCPLRFLYLGRNLSNYYSSPFAGVSTPTEVTIGNSVTSIESYAFSGCANLTNVIIGNSVTSIEEKAFEDCTGLTSITIPNAVTRIRDNAFYGCTALEELIIEDGTNTLALGYNGYEKGLFYDCPLKSLYLGRNLSYDNSERYGYSPFYNKSTLTEVTIGSSVTSIADYAFNGCTALEKLIIEDGTNTLALGCNERIYYIINDNYYDGKGLFYDCPLKSLYLGRNLSYDNSSWEGYSPFYKRSKLTEVTIGNTVTSIGIYAFYNCSGLANITIGNSVTSIGYYAFSDCSGLTNIYSLNPTPPTYSTGFSAANYQNATLSVPDEAVEKYRTKSPWSKFFNIIGFTPTGIQGIEAPVNDRQNTYYDMSGRKLDKPRKGLNIINGKKVIIK